MRCLVGNRKFTNSVRTEVKRPGNWKLNSKRNTGIRFWSPTWHFTGFMRIKSNRFELFRCYIPLINRVHNRLTRFVHLLIQLDESVTDIVAIIQATVKKEELSKLKEGAKAAQVPDFACAFSIEGVHAEIKTGQHRKWRVKPCSRWPLNDSGRVAAQWNVIQLSRSKASSRAQKSRGIVCENCGAVVQLGNDIIGMKFQISAHLTKRPDESQDDVRDLNAIQLAKDTLGNYSLKSSEEYEVWSFRVTDTKLTHERNRFPNPCESMRIKSSNKWRCLKRAWFPCAFFSTNDSSSCDI